MDQIFTPQFLDRFDALIQATFEWGLLILAFCALVGLGSRAWNLGRGRPARIEALEARVTFLEKAMLVRQPTDEEAPSPPD